MLRPYRLLASIPHAPSLMIFSLVGRLHVPAIPIVLTFLLVDWSGSYAAGGVVSGVITLGQAIAGPLRGRSADRRSASKLLAVTGSGFAAGLAVIMLLTRPGGLAPSQWWLVLPVALLTGLSFPPVNQIGRALWSRIADGPARAAAYAVEATAQELLYVFGPVFFAFVIAGSGAGWAGVLCALWSVVGPGLFALVLWRAGLGAPQRERERGPKWSDSLFEVPGFARMLGFGMTIVCGLVSVDLLIIGWARELGSPQLAGVLAAVWALGSLFGGLVLGASRRVPPLWLLAVAVGLGFAALVLALPPVSGPAAPALVGGLLLVSGMTVAPTLAVGHSLLGELAPAERSAEAFGWFLGATTVGSALAAPIAGWFLDVTGPAAVAAFATGLAGVATALAAHHSVRTSRWKPPIEETATT